MVNCIGSSLLCLTGTVPFLADALPITRLGAVDTPNYNHHSTLRPRLVVSHHATMTIPLYAELEAFMSETHTQATPDRQIPGIFSADTPVASNDDNDHEREDYFGTSQRHASGAVTRTRAPHCIVRPYTNGSEDDAPIEILAGDVAVVQGQHIACLSDKASGESLTARNLYPNAALQVVCALASPIESQCLLDQIDQS